MFRILSFILATSALYWFTYTQSMIATIPVALTIFASVFLFIITQAYRDAYRKDPASIRNFLSESLSNHLVINKMAFQTFYFVLGAISIVCNIMAPHWFLILAAVTYLITPFIYLRYIHTVQSIINSGSEETKT